MANVRHVQHHLAAVLAEVEEGEVIEVHHRGQPLAWSLPVPSEPPRADWSHAEQRLQAAYPTPAGGATAAQAIADGRGEG